MALIELFRRIIAEYGYAIMLAIGYCGQVVFGLRFVVQWIATERRRQVTVPLAFWYLSLVGTVLLLSWAIYRGDPVLIPGFCLNMIIYLRNLYFARQPRAAAAETNEPTSQP